MPHMKTAFIVLAVVAAVIALSIAGMFALVRYLSID
jgi:hypothetical protein